MIEGNKNSENDDLSEFVNYLAEFDSLISFDNETCPVCGIKISDSLSIEKSPYVQYKYLREESELICTTNELDSKSIPYKVEKQLDSSTLNQILYNYIVLIPFKCLSEIQKK